MECSYSARVDSTPIASAHSHIPVDARLIGSCSLHNPHVHKAPALGMALDTRTKTDAKLHASQQGCELGAAALTQNLDSGWPCTSK